jgi:hypothetical protein
MKFLLFLTAKSMKEDVLKDIKWWMITWINLWLSFIDEN